jgi:glycosyltransferase involved in cell wall biosynthesis
MNIESRADDGLVQLTSTVERLIGDKRFGDALGAVQRFVERVIFDPASVARVFASAELDALCKTIAMAGLRAKSEPPPAPTTPGGTVILVSELSLAGGHNELLRDIVRLRLFPVPVRIVQTDCFDRVDEQVSRDFSTETGVAIQRAEGDDLGAKFDGIIDLLSASMPRNMLLLVHNQDALAIASAFAAKARAADLEVVYIHHGDHHLSLGAATREFVHVDPHNIGYFHCRDALGHEGNRYWPLIAHVESGAHRQAPFLTAGHLVTCSSGRAEKFEAGSYRHDYFELLPLMLRASGGTHIHIGGLLPERLETIARSLLAAGVDPARFVHVPWVKSVAQALIEQGVDLYISSFPLGGGKATLEAMAAGIPLLMHQSYRSRFLGGEDIAYPGAFVWRTPDQLLDILGDLDAATLAEHSARARHHYETYHHDRMLIAACDFSAPQDLAVIPPLKDYRSDPLECFLDDRRMRAVDAAASRLRIEAQTAELDAYEAQAQDFQSQLIRMTERASLAEAELAKARNATNAQIEDELSKMERSRREMSDCCSELASHGKEIKSQRQETLRVGTALEANLEKIRAELDAIANCRLQIERDASAISEIRRAAPVHVHTMSPSDLPPSALLAEIHALRTSTSWRVTRPLRLLSRLLKKGAVDTDTAPYVLPGAQNVASDGPAIAGTGSIAQRVASQLPADFVGSIYLKLNPDLKAAGVDPASHFLSHGQRENRRYALPDFNVARSHRFDAALSTVLLVSHEASRTGAPILSLNLAQTLARKHNVVVLLLGGGALTAAFEATGATVLTASAARGSPFVADYVVSQICEQFEFDFALVNSIESRAVLPALAERFVPTISLVHEFASYTRPREAFREALQWSSEVVFSANVTRDNALSTFPELAEASATVLPQGKCLLPSSSDDQEAERREGERLQRLIRPKDLPPETLVVLGAGFVQLRKGVDLFIECASRVKRQASGRKFRFVWIGNGYDPDVDVAYSVYLQDQIQRADLSSEVVFLGESSAIEAAYEVADLFLLSSRLDPLPNVAIDAMSQGVPVLCFDKTTGIADFLHDVGLGEACVAGYFDTEGIAARIIGFADSRQTIAEVGAECQARAAEYFNMAGYVGRLESLAQEIRLRVEQEAADCATILEAGVLRPDFADLPVDAPVQNMVRRYVRTWASGIGRRKPFPGFHPGIYLERHGVAVVGGDPLADYLRAGRPQGPWDYAVIDPDGARTAAPSAMRVALHIHAYYVDLLPEIIGRLATNRHKVDLFISVANHEAIAVAQAHAATHAGCVVSVRAVPNRGRDIGPFFTEFFEAMRDGYDIVGHFHTKKSVDLKEEQTGRRWFSFLADNLLGNATHGMLDVVLDRFERDPGIGMVFADDPHISGMETNLRFAEPWRQRLGIEAIPAYFIYPVGTMFWARPAALRPIADLKLQWEDYPPEPLPYDGSMLHALERLIALAVPAENWRIATTNVRGVTR